jgi:predicted alpha/beta superfamily hydrolase
MMRLRLPVALLFLSVCTIPAFAQLDLKVDRLTIKSEVLGEDRLALVRTPPGYDKDAKRYPVLYMTDGAAQLVHTVSTIEFLSRNGRAPEMIVVAITNTDRTRDLTPTRASMMEDGRPDIPFPTSGGADKFLKFIETELIPKIESGYRVQPYRIFAGHSFGGLFAVNAFLTRPDAFNAYIAVSPSMHWDHQLMVRRADEFFKNRKELNKTLVLTIANEGGEMRVGFDRFKEILAKQKPAGFIWDSAVMEDEDHGSVVLRSHYIGFKKIFEGWQAPPTVARNGLGAVERHYKNLSTRFGYEITPPEQLMNALGYTLLGEDRIEEAVKVFKSNIERYPMSANVYDSLAECYERTGKLDLARPNYEKAMQLGEKNNDPNAALFRKNFERVDGALRLKAEGKTK